MGLRSRAKCAASPSWGRGGWREEYYLQRALYVRPRGRGRLPFAGASPSVTEARVLRWTHDRTRGLRRMPSSYKAQPAFAPASILQAASSKEGYPSGKRSLCSSSRARSVPARVEVNRQNPCPKMQKLWKLVPLSRVERATRAHIARQERATTLRRALLQPLRCPGKNQGCVQHKHPQAIAAPGSRHRPGRRDTSA